MPGKTVWHFADATLLPTVCLQCIPDSQHGCATKASCCTATSQCQRSTEAATTGTCEAVSERQSRAGCTAWTPPMDAQRGCSLLPVIPPMCCAAEMALLGAPHAPHSPNHSLLSSASSAARGGAAPPAIAAPLVTSASGAPPAPPRAAAARCAAPAWGRMVAVGGFYDRTTCRQVSLRPLQPGCCWVQTIVQEGPLQPCPPPSARPCLAVYRGHLLWLPEHS